MIFLDLFILLYWATMQVLIANPLQNQMILTTELFFSLSCYILVYS